jgi:ABC-type multidrug transport system fused ATPase/permease subunit
MTLLTHYLTPQRARVGLMAALLLGGIGLQLVNPQIIRYFLDTVQSGGAKSALWLAAGLYLGFALIQQAAKLAASMMSQNVAWTATNALRRDLTLHCLRLDLPFHQAHAPGELIERIDGDANELALFFSEFVINVLGNGLLILGVLALLAREDWRVGAGLALYVVVTLVILTAVQNVAVKRWGEARQASAEQYGFIEERLVGAEDLRANGAVPYTLYRLQQFMRRFLEKYRAAYTLRTVVGNFTNLLAVTGYAFGLGLGVYLFTRGEASLGTAYLIVNYTALLSEPLQNIRRQLQNWQQARASLGRIQELLDLQPSVRDRAGARPLPGGALAVEFDNVAFSYEGADRPRSVHGVSFQLRPGKVLGVLGRTGSGKTTLTRLLFRLYDPALGAVRFNGVDLREVPLNDLRARVGMVTQDVQLFKASLRDNLAFFNAGHTDAQMEQALRDLRLWEWFQKLPAGLDTPLDTSGRGLSAGEAQLLAFTRVFLKDPGLVILDEASSRLDPATETLLERGIDQLLAQRTGIIIAHRLRTVHRADDILILDQGRVAEFGSRKELLTNPNSRFSQLMKTGLEEALA